MSGCPEGSSVRMNPGTIGWSQNPEQHLNQMNTTNSALSARSTAVTNQGTNWETASSSQFPAVSFDLGNEWDNWGDFDDENLVHASETSFASGTTDAKPQIQQSIACNTPGSAATSVPLFLSPSQVKPCITTARTPVRSISPNVSPEIRKPGPSLVTVRPQNRITNDWNKKRSSILSEEIAVKTPGNAPKQMHVPPATRRFDFFSTMRVPANASCINSKEEEAFLGIFDGIF